MMKTWTCLFLLAMLLLAGCDKNDLANKNPIDFKAECWSVPDLKVSSKYMIGGTASLLGEINTEQSYFDFKTVKYMEIDGFPFFDMRGSGKMTGGNADSFEFNFKISQSLIDQHLVGKIDIIPGSGIGIFKGCCGCLYNIGRINDNELQSFIFTIKGSLAFD